MRRGCAARIARACSDKGMTCSRRFFVLAGGSVMVAASRSTSDQLRLAISSRRAPLSINSLTIAPYWLLVGGAPDHRQLVVAQHAIARSILDRLVGVGDRIAIDVTLARGP